MTPDIAGVDLVPASAIINGIKCELNDFYRAHVSKANEALTLSPDYMSNVEISLKIVASSTAQMSAKAVIPLSAVSFGPELGGSVNRSTTVTQTSTYLMRQHAEKALDCSSLTASLNGIELRKWLAASMDDQKAIVAGDPKVGLSTVVLETAFGVTTSGNAGGSVDIVPLTVSASVAASRNDIQNLKITFIGTVPPGSAVKASLVPNITTRSHKIKVVP